MKKVVRSKHGTNVECVSQITKGCNREINIID